MNRIIVVDDDEEVLDTIQLVLELGGYDVEPLNDAALLSEKIEIFKPDLIILDIVLGKLDGRAINNELKSNFATRNIPVLMMSGLYHAKDIAALPIQPNDFLPKPFKMNDLLDKISALINNQGNKRELVN